MDPVRGSCGRRTGLVRDYLMFFNSYGTRTVLVCDPCAVQHHYRHVRELTQPEFVKTRAGIVFDGMGPVRAPYIYCTGCSGAVYEFQTGTGP